MTIEGKQNDFAIFNMTNTCCSLTLSVDHTLAQQSTTTVTGQATTVAAPTMGTGTTSATQEHRRLFTQQSRPQPYRVRNGRSNRVTVRVKWFTKTVFSFANKNQSTAPSSVEKIELQRNGLCEQ